MNHLARLRAEMVEQQLRGRGISDQRVLEAMGEVRRELFVPEESQHLAYADGALPIGHDQTISQPLMVAEICQGLLLEGDERVLEIGTGSGYSAAVLSHLCKEVVSIERIPELTRRAEGSLEESGVGNVTCISGDGSAGWPELAPYDAIAVHAGAPEISEKLVAQLSPGGRLVVPVSADGGEVLTRITVGPQGSRLTEDLGQCRFVPLIGEEGYAP